MSGRSDALARFLTAEAAHAEPDGCCGKFLARWRTVVTGQPGTGLRLTGDRGDLYRIMTRQCQALGLVETVYPKRGDVALVAVGNAVVAAICTGDGFVTKTARGLLVLRQGAALRAWEIA